MIFKSTDAARTRLGNFWSIISVLKRKSKTGNGAAEVQNMTGNVNATESLRNVNENARMLGR